MSLKLFIFNFYFLNIYGGFFWITVYIQYYFGLVSGVQHSRWTVIYFTKCSPDIHNSLVSYLVISILLTIFPVLYFTSPLPFCNYQSTSQSLHLFHPIPKFLSHLATIGLLFSVYMSHLKKLIIISNEINYHFHNKKNSDIHLKYMWFLFVNYTSINMENSFSV